MDVRYILKNIVSVLQKLERSPVDVPLERPMFSSFPFEFARVGQNNAIKTMLEHDFTCLAFPTGWGKTVCFLTALCEWIKQGGVGIIFTRTNSLQEQIVKYNKYYKDIVLLPLFAREKECVRLVDNTPACYSRINIGRGSIFWYNGKRYSYPCYDCPYDHKLREIENYLAYPKGRRKIIPVFNAGHFFLVNRLIRGADRVFVVIDEADSTIDMVMEPIEIPVDVVDDPDDSELVLNTAEKYYQAQLQDVKEEIRGIVHEIKNKASSNYVPFYLIKALKELRLKRENIENKILKLSFFRTYPENLISYVRNEKVYLEVVNYNPLSAIKRLLGNVEKICLVTATPTVRMKNVKVIDLEGVKYRNKIIVVPVANMSYSKVQDKDFYIASKIIVAVMLYVLKRGYSCKFVLHAGNNHTHAVKFKKAIEELWRKYTNSDLSILIKGEEDTQLKIIREFKSSKKPVLLIGAGFEYGEDFTDVTAQFIGKVGYPPLKDPRTEKMKEFLGEEKFRRWYVYEAIRKIIQAGGRNSRSPNSFSFTMILDSSFVWLYRRYSYLFQRWFVERLIFIPIQKIKSGEYVGRANI